MTESVNQYGVLTLVIVRLLDGGGYKIISGHRCKYASEAIGWKIILHESKRVYFSEKSPIICLT